MAQVSLIYLDRDDSPAPQSRLSSWVEAVADAGHSVELIRVGGPISDSFHDGMVRLESARQGLSPDAFAGLRRATGDILLVVDGSRAYPPNDLIEVIEPLVAGAAKVVVGDHNTQGWRKLVLAGMRPLTGSWAPFSSLIGMTSAAYRQVEHEFQPVGHRFALEILARIREGRLDVEILGDGVSGSTTLHFDDIRHAKRLADDKLGNISRLIQFCVVGASGMVVDLTCYLVLQWLFARTALADQPPFLGSPLDLAAARILAISIALVWNFTLNRHLTFNYAKKGPLLRQFVTYVLSNALGVTLSLTLSLSLPRKVDYFARHRLAAAVVGIVAATGISFSMSRWVVFRPRPSGSTLIKPIAAPTVSARSS
jgi:dolichol-phosphate mannosyltransferase